MEPLFRKMGFKINGETKAKNPQKKLEETQENSIISPSKITESTSDSPHLKKFLMTAGAIKNEIDEFGREVPDKSRKEILDSLERPIHHLGNGRIKLRTKGDYFIPKKRSLLTIKSRIGGPKSKEAVRSLLSQLETASKLPSDTKSPSIVEMLDKLLDNQWASKTIKHDTTGKLKDQFLNILANEMIGDPSIETTKILLKLDANIENKLAKRAKEAVKTSLAQLEANSISNNYRDVQYIPNDLNNLLDNELLNKAISEDRELRTQFLNILSNEVIHDSSISHEKINTMLSKLNPNIPLRHKVNEFEEMLLDNVFDLVQERKCQGSANYRRQLQAFQSVSFGFEYEMSESYLKEYHKLLKVMEPKELENEKLETSYKTTFGPQFAKTHEEAMESLKTQYYVIEKTENKFIYHIDLIRDGKREIRSKEISEAEAKNPKIIKVKLDRFIDQVNKDHLNPKE